MTIKSSGSLSFYYDIHGEFGGAAPLSLSQYYRGGSHVGNYSTNNNIPVDGSPHPAIKFSDFYGASSIPPISPTTLSYTSYSGKIYFTTLLGIKHFTVTVCIGGGAGGGPGTESYNGYGGGGGGSGGYYQNYQYSITSNDYIECWPGAAGGPWGSGGNSTVAINGTAIMIATGGQAPNNAYSVGGGAGGTPNGNPGADGLVGSYDGASGYGGNGASSPWGTGGARGAPYDSYGKNASGYGAGGGGAGFTDRMQPLIWNGGSGSTGFIQIYYDAN